MSLSKKGKAVAGCECEACETRRAKDRVLGRKYYYQHRERNREQKNAAARDYYKRNREKVRADQARYREEVKAIVAEAREGPCADCGVEYPPVVMQFHHRNPEEKRFDVGNAGTPNQAREELAKCDLLCANCHCLRHDEPRIFLDGTRHDAHVSV